MRAIRFAEYGFFERSCQSLLSLFPRKQRVNKREKETGKAMKNWGETEERDIPTELSAMMPWALMRAAAVEVDMVALEPKKRRKNEMVGETRRDVKFWCVFC